MNKKDAKNLIESCDGVIIGKTVDDEKMIIFSGWENISNIVSKYNGLDKPDARSKLTKLGVKDIDAFLKGVAKYGTTYIQNPEGFIGSIIPDIDVIITKVYGKDMSWGFDDEYSTCSDCCTIFRTSPDCYQWTPDYVIMDDSMICKKCIVEDVDRYIKHITNTTKSVLMDSIPIDITKHGWVEVGEKYEAGLYEGKNQDPVKILKLMNEKGIDVIFHIEPSQFTTYFNVYVRDEDAEKAKDLLKKSDIDYPSCQSPADMCKKALSSAKLQMPEGEGITYVKCNADGTATVKKITPKEFIDGIKE